MLLFIDDRLKGEEVGEGEKQQLGEIYLKNASMLVHPGNGGGVVGR